MPRTSSLSAGSFSSSAISFWAAGALSLVSFLVSRNLSAALLSSSVAASEATSSFNFSTACSLSVFCPRYIPKPCSALSSNSELAQAGPFLESLLTVYGDVAAGPPQIDEQPVALDIYICSPKSCVISLA